jgi:hypothetical protein
MQRIHFAKSGAERGLVKTMFSLGLKNDRSMLAPISLAIVGRPIAMLCKTTVVAPE